MVTLGITYLRTRLSWPQESGSHLGPAVGQRYREASPRVEERGGTGVKAGDSGVFVSASPPAKQDFHGISS